MEVRFRTKEKDMKNIDIIKKHIGEYATEEMLKNIDCYVRPQLSVFIPTSETGYFPSEHPHPSYIIKIFFEQRTDKQMHYEAEITSPQTKYSVGNKNHFYCIMIDKDFFEKRYLMYGDKLPRFCMHKFEMCSDVLKALNTFAFESSKSMLNSDITLDAQSEIITHWIIRSIFGETLDMRAISDDYSVARAQHYMEQHYMDNITVAKLSELGYVSPSSFNRRFKNEIGITPIEYLIEIRLKHAKTLLKRKNIPITEIAMRCGFGSNSHFSSCFQNKVGISPSEYRDRY